MRRPPLCFLVLGLAACGTDPKTFVDAGPVDATTNDGSTATASVTARVRTRARDGLPDPTATVFLTSPSGVIEAQGHPDLGGDFTGLVTPGGSVTVGWSGAKTYLETITDVAHQDQFWFGADADPVEQQMTITVPPRAGANGYRVIGPCMDGFSSSTTIPTTFNDRCGATHPLVLHVQFVGAPIMYLSAPAVTPAAGTTVAVPGIWGARVTTPLSIRGVPAGSGGVTLTRTITVGGADSAWNLLFDVVTVDGVGTGNFNGPANFGDGTHIEARYGLANNGYAEVHVFRPTLTEAAPVDVGPNLPALTGLTRDGATVSWTVASAGATDAISLDLSHSDDGKSEAAHWRVVLPPTAMTYTFPSLPAPFDLSQAPVQDVRAIDTSTIDQPDVFRARAGTGLWIDHAPFPAPTDARWSKRSAER